MNTERNINKLIEDFFTTCMFSGKGGDSHPGRGAPSAAYRALSPPPPPPPQRGRGGAAPPRGAGRGGAGRGAVPGRVKVACTTPPRSLCACAAPAAGTSPGAAAAREGRGQRA